MIKIREELKPFLAVSDWEILARCLLGETEGESELGKLAVACVIRNRLYGNAFPNSYHEVILQPMQFSCFNKDSPRLHIMLYPETNKTYPQCIRLAKSVILESALDITGGADHYFNESVVQPTWAQKMIRTCKIGNHVFYLSLNT